LQHRGIKINCVYERGYFGVAQGTTKQLTCHQTHALDETLRSKAVTHLDFRIKINHPNIVVLSFDDEKNVLIFRKHVGAVRFGHRRRHHLRESKFDRHCDQEGYRQTNKRHESRLPE
jgi:hypothetical protein